MLLELNIILGMPTSKIMFYENARNITQHRVVSLQVWGFLAAFPNGRIVVTKCV